jgi:predicted transcriptional regulator
MPMRTQKDTVTFRLDHTKRKKLDQIASREERDRSYIINQAISSYIASAEWQTAHIKDGLHQADAGELIGAEKVSKWIDSWGTKCELPQPTARK